MDKAEAARTLAAIAAVHKGTPQSEAVAVVDAALEEAREQGRKKAFEPVKMGKKGLFFPGPVFEFEGSIPEWMEKVGNIFDGPEGRKALWEAARREAFGEAARALMELMATYDRNAEVTASAPKPGRTNGWHAMARGIESSVECVRALAGQFPLEPTEDKQRNWREFCYPGKAPGGCGVQWGDEDWPHFCWKTLTPDTHRHECGCSDVLAPTDLGLGGDDGTD